MEFSNLHYCTFQKESLQVAFKKRPQACNFIKKRLLHRCFSVDFVNILRKPFSKNGCFCLFLSRSKNKILTFLEKHKNDIPYYMDNCIFKLIFGRRKRRLPLYSWNINFLIFSGLKLGASQLLRR